MVATTSGSDDTHWLETESVDDWVSTPHEKVYFRDVFPKVVNVNTDNFVKAGALVSKKLPGDWTVIITAGPNRGYDVGYVAQIKLKRIHLDFYSPRPGFQYLNDVIEDVMRQMNNSPDGGEEASA